MSDISRNYIPAREAATLTGVHIATIRRMCKKLLKSSDPTRRELCFQKFEENSERFEYMIDKEFAISQWKPQEQFSSASGVPSGSLGSTDRALDIMEKVVSSLVEQNKQFAEQNRELKEQNKKFYDLISEMSRRGFFLDAPKPAGADISGQATTITPQPSPQEEVKESKKGFFARLFGK